jgi:hypothetical protein
MKKITAQRHDNSCIEAINQLNQLGFNPHLLASKKLNEEKLERLSNHQKIQLKSILEKIKTPRLRRTLKNNPYADYNSYKLALEKANSTKLANTLKTLSILTQEKIYLFWTATRQKVF